MAMRMTQAAPMIFGAGSLAVLGDELKNRGVKSAVIITDKGVTGAGVTAKVEDVIKAAGVGCSVWDECLSDAPSDTIAVAAAAIRDSGADIIIALGGGSSMDTAKAASLIIKEEKPIQAFMIGPGAKPGVPDLPVITIPTTSGTGSEVTVVGVISDSVTSNKFGVMITGPALAIVDPELTVGLPPQITAMTGMDVIAHAVEAISGVGRNPLSDIRGFEALRLANAHLPGAVADGENIVAREGMSLASSLAGMAFNDSITSLGHAISQALASAYHLHHGLLCGLATPPQLEIFATAIPQRIRKIGEIFGADIPADASPEQIGKITAVTMRSFMSKVGIPSFEQLGYSRKDIVDRTDALMAEFMKDLSPLPITRDVAYRALDSMCDYEG